MKGVQIVEPNKLQIVDLEKPQIDKENNVLVRMVAAGICGSDVGIYHGTNAAATYPRIIGHENVGIVEEINAHGSSHSQQGREQDQDGGDGLHEHADEDQEEVDEQQDQVLVGGQAQHCVSDHAGDVLLGQDEGEHVCKGHQSHDSGSRGNRILQAGVHLLWPTDMLLVGHIITPLEGKCNLFYGFLSAISGF